MSEKRKGKDAMLKRLAICALALGATVMPLEAAASSSAAVTATVERDLASAGLSPAVLASAMSAYNDHGKRIANRRYVAVIDYTRTSAEPRFFLYDTETGLTETFLVAHGRNSDPDHTGVPRLFSNEPGSRMTSVGAYLTAETYHGKHGYSLRLDGLSASNDRARDRAIVIHGADYVAKGRKLGRSWGCPALERSVSDAVIDKIKEGAFLYIHGSSSSA
jgi:hypothetical protein